MDNIAGVLMSIKPKYAQAILSGEKKMELRRCIPRIKPRDIIVFYESSPIQRITFYCEISEIIIMPPKELWNRYNSILGIAKEDYDKYFSNRSIAYGIMLQKANIFSAQIKISDVSQRLSVPQNFRYISSKELKTILQR